MDFKKVIDYRRSIRDFEDTPIDNTVLERIVAQAQTTPSWANSQPWRVHIATGQTLKQIQADHLLRSRQGIPGNADFSNMHREDWNIFPRKNMAEWSQSLGMFLGFEGGQMGQSQIKLFNAPALVYLTIPRDSPEWSVFDLGMFSQTLMLAAANQKIDSIPAYEIIKYPDLIRQYMNISDNEILAMGIALGYQKDDTKINQFQSSRVAENKILTIED